MKKIYLFGILFLTALLPLQGKATDEDPTFVVNPNTSINFGYVEIGETNDMSFEVSCQNYTGNALVIAAAPFTVSIDGTTFSDTVSFPSSGATIYVRYTPTEEGYLGKYLNLVVPGIAWGDVYVYGRGITCDHSIPYSYSFNNSQTNNCWTVVDANNDSKKFSFSTSGQYAYYTYHSTNPADDWLISPEFQLNGNQIGYFEYKVTNANYPERFQVVALGADTIPLSPVIVTNNTVSQTFYFDMTALNGPYQIGIHCVSAANMYTLRISNFNIINNTPNVIFNSPSITFPITVPGESSQPAQAMVTTIGATSNPIILSAPTQFELSEDGITYGTSLTLVRGSGNIQTDTFFVRFSPTAYYSDTIQDFLIASYAGIQDSATLTGLVIDCENTIPYTFHFNNDKTACWTVVDANNDGKKFTFYKTSQYVSYSYHLNNPADDWLISPVFEFDGNQYGFFEYMTSLSYHERFQVFALGDDTIPLSPIIDTNSNQWTKQFMDLTPLNGSYRIGIHCVSAKNMNYLRITNFNVLPIVPTISILEDSLTFHLTPTGSSSDAQLVLVNSMGSPAPIVVTVPQYFEVSYDGINYSSSLTLPASSATFRLDTLFVRFVPTEVGFFSQMLTVSYSGLSDTLFLKGSARDCSVTLSIPLEEGFEGDYNYCWTAVDQGNSGRTWEPSSSRQRSGSQCVRSTPVWNDYLQDYLIDNWLISAPILLTDSALMSFYVRPEVGGSQSFSVYLSTTGSDIADFTTELQNYQPFFNSSSIYYQYIIPLDEYVGQTVRIAIRHYNASNSLFLDDISIATPEDHPLISTSKINHLFEEVGVGEMKTEVCQVTGHGLTDAITATVEAPFSVSTDGTNFAQTATLPSEGGTLYFRFSPTSLYSSSKEITLSSPGAADAIIQLSGSGIECYNTIPYTHLFNHRNGCWDVVDANEDGYHFYFQTTTPSYAYVHCQVSGDDWLISPTLPLDGNQYGYFEYSYANQYGKFQVFVIGADTVPVTDVILVDNFIQNGTKTIRFDLTPFSGPYHIGIHTIQDIAYSTLYFSNFNVKNIVPTLEFQEHTVAFGEVGSNTGSAHVHQVILSEIGIYTPISLNVSGAFEISLNGIDYSSSLTIPAKTAGLDNDTVFIRPVMDNGGEFSGLLTATAEGLLDSVTLSSSVFECDNTIPYFYSFNNAQTNKCWTVVNANNDYRTFNFNTSNGYAYYNYISVSNANDWLISPQFQLNGNQYGSFDYRSGSTYYTERFEVAAIGMGDTVMLVPPTTVSYTSFQTLLLDLSSLNGDYQIGIHCISDTNQHYFYVKNFKVEHFVPTITVNEQQVNFGVLVSHELPGAQQLVVNGSGVFAPINVTAPTGYEVSADGVTYSGCLTFPARSYGFTTDTFYIRFNPTAEGNYDNLLIVSSNSCADTVLLHGSIFYCETPISLPYTEEFEDALTPCWNIIDYDGDGHSWIPTADVAGTTGHQSANAYVSLGNIDYPFWWSQNNYLVTPMFVPTANTVMAFYTKGTEGIPQHYNVYVGSGNDILTFLDSEPVFSRTVGGTWEENAVSLAEYAGDTVYVAFHHNDQNDGLLYIDDLVITDNLNHPVVMADSTSLSFGSVIIGKSATKQLEITTFGLTSSTSAFSSVHYLLSVDGTNFSQVVTIPASGGTLYVRYTPTSENIEEGTITIFVPGSPGITIALSGHGFDCLNTIPYSYQFNDEYISCWGVENSNGDNKTFTFETDNSRATYHYSSQNAADDWLISPSFQFNGNQYGHFDYYCNSSNFHERFEVLAIGADTVLIVSPMVINNTTAQTLNLDLSILSGEYAIAIHCISNPNQYNFYIENFNILNVTPSITVEQDSLEFILIPLNGTSESQTVTFYTMDINTPITVTVPSPFEVSSDNINFANSAIIPSSSNLFDYDTIYVRFSPTSTDPTQGTLTIAAGDIQATVALTGTSRDCDEVLSLPIFEGFEGASTYCWTPLDQDGDGFTWYVEDMNHAHSGSQNATSASFSPETSGLNPDNWLVSQPIQLPEIPARLSFWVKEIYGINIYEHYSVYISTTGSTAADFTDVLLSGDATTTFVQQSVSLRDYAGQTVRIAFRHHDTYDVYRIVLDDIDIRLDSVPQLPIVVTDSVFSISQMSAVCIGHTVFDGNETVTACGFVWGTSPNPTLANNVTNSTPGLSTMIGMLTGLSEHTTYYVRAFATNSIGTEYGEEIVFTTLCGPATYTSFSQSACEEYTWNDTTYYESGDYVQNFSNMIGCDSIVTLHLTILHGTHNAVTETACDTFEWHGVNYIQSGVYTYNYTNTSGCASTDTLHLTILQSNQSEMQETACESFTWNGVTYTETGDYTQTFTNAAGCDSVVTLHLTVHYGTHNAVAETACDSYEWHGDTYTESGTFTYAYTNADGCASTDTLHLTIHYSDSTEFTVSECNSYTWNDSVYLQSGDYTQTFANLHGCDSVVTLHLTIHYSDSTEFSVSECESYTWNDTEYQQSGDYTQTLTNLHGCDSVVTLHLSIYPNVSSEETVSWPDSCYLWNGESYCATGDYTQTLTTVHGCDSVVTLHLSITVGVEHYSLDNALRIYPNPTNGIVNVSGTAFTEVQLFDAYGKLLGRWPADGETMQLDLSRHAAGVYIIKVLNHNEITSVKKLLKR